MRFLPPLALLLTASVALAQPAKEPHMVFAHYMVCFATYGESIEAYQREMKEAQAAGIDGFALNVGAWTKEPHYIRRTKLIYEAAKQLNSDFKLFFSVDMSIVPDVQDMIRTYAHHPNQFMYHGKTVVSTFAQEGLDWKTLILDPLRQEGVDIFFVPHFYPRPNVTELPDYAVVMDNYRKHADVMDGMFYFGAAGLPEQLAASNAAHARAMKEVGKLCMASYTPHYWGFSQPNRRYYETQGGIGTEVQWRSIIESQPEWVEIVTWSDFQESSYISPIVNPGQYFSQLLTPPRNCHAGYLELTKYFIQWYKQGQPPAIERDGLFYCYRVHPKDAKPTTEDRPVTAFYGPVEDVLYVTTLLTTPGQVRVTSGGEVSVHDQPAGLAHLKIPFKTGPQRFEVLRDGKAICTVDGPVIEEQPEKLNFFPATGYAYSR